MQNWFFKFREHMFHGCVWVCANIFDLSHQILVKIRVQPKMYLLLTESIHQCLIRQEIACHSPHVWLESLNWLVWRLIFQQILISFLISGVFWLFSSNLIFFWSVAWVLNTHCVFAYMFVCLRLVTYSLVRLAPPNDYLSRAECRLNQPISHINECPARLFGHKRLISNCKCNCIRSFHHSCHLIHALVRSLTLFCLMCNLIFLKNFLIFTFDIFFN